MMLLGLWALQPSGFFDTKDEGWHFYHDPLLVPQQKENDTEPKTFAVLKQQVQESLEEAILNPTLSNVRRYQHIQKKLMDRSERFANVWAQVLLEEPGLDHTLKAPPSYYGSLAYKKNKEETRRQKLMAGKDTYALFLFVGKGDDYASKGLFNVVSPLAEYRGYTLNVLTDDPQCALPGAVSEQGLKGCWDVKRLPALVLNHIPSGHGHLITYGLMAADAIEERMVALMEAES